jgi:hypothetical protein
MGWLRSPWEGPSTVVNSEPDPGGVRLLSSDCVEVDEGRTEIVIAVHTGGGRGKNCSELSMNSNGMASHRNELPVVDTGVSRVGSPRTELGQQK